MDNKPTILAIDDEVDILDVIKSSLQGYKVITLNDPLKAMKTLEENEVDLILLDQKMPNLGGFELCQQLKSDDKYKAIPVIFLTAFNDKSDIVKGLKLGAVDYVGKPFIREVLEARINTQIQNIKLQQKVTTEKQLEVLESIINDAISMFEPISTELSNKFSSIEKYKDDLKELQGFQESVNKVKNFVDYLKSAKNF